MGALQNLILLILALSLFLEVATPKASSRHSESDQVTFWSRDFHDDGPR